MTLEWATMRPALVALTLVLAAGPPGCGSSAVRRDACFTFPADAACPGEDVVVLYLGDETDGCNELSSIDSPGEHRGPQCCYHVTSSHDTGCDFEP